MDSLFHWFSKLTLENKLLTIFFLLFFLYIVYMFFFSTLAKTKRKFKNIASTQIFKFKNGDIGKVIGKVENIKEPLIAPLSGKKCVYYEVIVSDSSGEDNILLLKEKKYHHFYIVNSSGKAFVKIDKDTICEITSDIDANTGFWKKPKKEMKVLLEKHKIKQKNFLDFNKSLNFIEKRYDVGEQIGVLGKGYWVISPEKLNQSNKKVLTFKSLQDAPLFISDNPKTLKRKSNTLAL